LKRTPYQSQSDLHLAAFVAIALNSLMNPYTQQFQNKHGGV